MHDLELFVMIDADGDYVVAKDRDDLAEKWEEEIGDVPAGSRVLAIKLAVDSSDTALTAMVPADARAATMAVQA